MVIYEFCLKILTCLSKGGSASGSSTARGGSGASGGRGEFINPLFNCS